MSNNLPDSVTFFSL